MEIITTIIYIALFIILMIFVFSIGLIRKFMPKKEIILVLLVAFLIGSMGGAFFLEPIYKEMPSALNIIEKNMPYTDEVLYLDIPSSIDSGELYQNLSHTDGFKSYKEERISIPMWAFTDKEVAYFEGKVQNISSHYKNSTVNASGVIQIELDDNYTAAQALKSFSDWYKLVYGRSISYAKIHSKLVIDSYAYDEFKQNLLHKGIVPTKLEGPIQNDLNSTDTHSGISNTYFVLITGLIGVAVALMGIFVDSVVVYYRRFRKFLNTKRKR